MIGENENKEEIDIVNNFKRHCAYCGTRLAVMKVYRNSFYREDTGEKVEYVKEILASCPKAPFFNFFKHTKNGLYWRWGNKWIDTWVVKWMLD